MGSEDVLRPSEIHSIYKIIYHFIRSISRPQFFVGPVLATTFNWPHNLKTESETHLIEMNVIVITWSLEIVPTRTANLKPNLALPLIVSLLLHFPLESHVSRRCMVNGWCIFFICFFFIFFMCDVEFQCQSFLSFLLYRALQDQWALLVMLDKQEQTLVITSWYFTPG